MRSDHNNHHKKTTQHAHIFQFLFFFSKRALLEFVSGFKLALERVRISLWSLIGSGKDWNPFLVSDWLWKGLDSVSGH